MFKQCLLLMVSLAFVSVAQADEVAECVKSDEKKGVEQAYSEYVSSLLSLRPGCDVEGIEKSENYQAYCDKDANARVKEIDGWDKKLDDGLIALELTPEEMQNPSCEQYRAMKEVFQSFVAEAKEFYDLL